MNWRRLFFLSKIVLSVTILGIVMCTVDVNRIGTSFQSLRIPLFCVALLLVPVNLSVQMLRWHFILKTVHVPLSPKDTLRSVLAGLSLSLITPGRLGEVGRSLFVPSSNTIQIVGLVILEKAYAFLAVLIASAISLVVLGKIWIGILLVVCVFVIASNLHIVRSLLSRLSFLLPFGEKVATLWSAWDYFQRKHISLLLSISLLFFSVVFAQFYVLVSAFQIIDLRPAMISIPLTMAINSLPLTVAGLGLREGAAVFFFSQFGVAKVAALNGAFLLFVIDILLPGLLGLLLLPRMKTRFESITEETS